MGQLADCQIRGTGLVQENDEHHGRFERGRTKLAADFAGGSRVIRTAGGGEGEDSGLYSTSVQQRRTSCDMPVGTEHQMDTSYYARLLVKVWVSNGYRTKYAHSDDLGGKARNDVTLAVG